MTLPKAEDGARTPAGDRPADRRLDLRGLHCPMPVLRARKALRQTAIGAAIVLDCTDPLTVIDIPHFVAEAGHELAATHRDGEVFTYRIVRRR